VVLPLFFVSKICSFALSFQAYKNPEVDFIRVTSLDIFMMLGIVFSLNFVVLLTWTLVAPLEWTRTFLHSTDIFDRYVASYGSCTNEDALAFSIVIVVLNVGFLLLANWWAYVSRNIETEYRESRYIGISMASVLQAWCMGVPILIVVWDNPSAKFFVEAGIVFVTALAVLFLIYVPKVLAIRADHIQRIREEKRNAYPRHGHRSRRNDVLDEDDLSDDKLGATKISGDHNGSDDEGKRTDSPKDSCNTRWTASSEISDDKEVGSTKISGDHNGSDDEGKRTDSPKDPCNTRGTASSEMTKTNGKETEDETIAAPAIAVGMSAPALSRGSEHSSRSIFASEFALKSYENTERKGGIKVLHNPRVRLLREPRLVTM
jgi:hypothetical protein